MDPIDDPIPDLPDPRLLESLDPEHAKYLALLRESQERKRHLETIQAQLHALRVGYNASLDQLREELNEKMSDVTKWRDRAARRDKELREVARACVPILRAYLLQLGAQGTSGLLPCGSENERNAKEMIVLLEPFTKT